jgi:hypothetical protein
MKEGKKGGGEEWMQFPSFYPPYHADRMYGCLGTTAKDVVVYMFKVRIIESIALK